MKNLQQYAEINYKVDVLGLAYSRIFGLLVNKLCMHSAHYYTNPGLDFDSTLK